MALELLGSAATLLQQGAEARLYAGCFYGQAAVVKERFPKRYRHPDLDSQLTRERMKNEVKSLLRCRRAGIRVPAVLLVDFPRRCLCLEFIANSLTVREFVNMALAWPDVSARAFALDKVSQKLGHILADMHSANIIHGDLTTSNMLLQLSHPGSAAGSDYGLPVWTNLAMIDFGLSYIAAEVEDKAVDLYVLERAFLSSHPNTEAQFALVLDTYRRRSKQGKIALRKLDEVRTRGRKRLMIG